MSAPKLLRVVTSRRPSNTSVVYLDLYYGSGGSIGTLHVPNEELSDIIQALKQGFDEVQIKEATRLAPGG